MRDPRRVVRASYERIAAAYLAARPRDGADVTLLAELAARVRPGGRVLDGGCGAGVPVSARLRDHGFDVVGLDVAAEQLALARDLVPHITVAQGDLAALPFPAASFDGLASFYALIHVPRSEHPGVLREMRRVLRPGGAALLCLGARDLAEDHDPDSWLGAPMYWSHFDAATNLVLLREAGFDVVVDRLVPDPMGHGEHLFALVTPR